MTKVDANALWESITGKSLAEKDKNFYLSDDGHTLKKYIGQGGDVIVPDGVKYIADEAFRNSNVTKVTLPISTVGIGEYAFQGCTSLVAINLENVHYIRSAAFSDCASLQEVDISGLGQLVDYFCFRNCTSLQKVTMPKTLQIIYRDAFNNCSSLKEITLPNGVSSYAGSIFANCTSLEKVSFGKGIWDIESNAFYGCTALKEVVILDLFRWIKSAFGKCNSLKRVILDGKRFQIDSWAFSDCPSLEYVFLGKGLEKIDWLSFDDCPALKEIYYGGTQKDWINMLWSCNCDTKWLENITIHYNCDWQDVPTCD